MIVNRIYHEDNRETMSRMPDNSIDMIATDSPYGISFMSKNWDKALPAQEIFNEMCRVLKPGAFCFCFSSPRQDVLWRMMQRLELAGFMIDLPSIYWTYATGMGLGANCGKLIDKKINTTNQRGWFGEWLKEWRLKNNLKQSDISRLFLSKTGGLTGCVANWELGLNVPTPQQFNKICNEFGLKFNKIEELKREVLSREKMTFGIGGNSKRLGSEKVISLPASDLAKKYDGAYVRYPPKPAVEVIIVAMKPPETKTYIEQVMKNGKACTWLDDVRVPVNNGDVTGWQGSPSTFGSQGLGNTKKSGSDNKGRYPTNLLSSGRVLDTGEITSSNASGYNFNESNQDNKTHIIKNIKSGVHFQDSGSFNRYFDFDAWARKTLPGTFPFLPVSKPSRSQKAGRESHLTEKPPQIFAYLITLASRPGDVIYDPFGGSCSSAVAAAALNRNFIVSELIEKHVKIGEHRISQLINKPEEKELIID
jgi:DNA modification methylase/transcriptional regulator with XRE-family HTH domain